MTSILKVFLAVLALATLIGPIKSQWGGEWDRYLDRNYRQRRPSIRDKLSKMTETLQTSQKQLESYVSDRNNLDELRRRFGLLSKNKPDTSGILNELESMKTTLNQKATRVKELQKNNKISTNIIYNSIQSLPASLADLIRNEVAKLIPQDNDQRHKDRNAKLDQLAQKLDRIGQATISDLNIMIDDFDDIKNALSKDVFKEACSNKSNSLIQHMVDIIENLFSKYEGKLNDFNVSSNKVQKYFVQLQDKSRASDECYNTLSSLLKEQDTSLKDIQKSLSTSQGVIEGLVTKQLVKASMNETLDAIYEAQYNVQDAAEKGVTNILSMLDELSTKQNRSQATLLGAMSTTNGLTSNMYAVVSHRNVDTRKKIDELSKFLKVGDLITQQDKDINSVFKQKFQDIELWIVKELQDQTTEFKGYLRADVKNEISDVQQHLAIVNEQLNTNKDVLEKLVDSNCRSIPAQ